MSNDETQAGGNGGGGTSHARATLDAWRERGADRLDPIRFHFMDALDRRAAGHGGQARRLLDDRLSKLLKAYGDDLESAARKRGDAAGAPAAPAPARGALGELVEYIASHATSHAAGRPPADGGGAAAREPRPGLAAFPELEVLDHFRETWSRLRVSSDRQLRQSQQQVPDNAGPLNSNHLVHRALLLMRELSPGYLQQFLSYVDALSWMEQMNGAGALAGKDAPRAGNARKSVRGKSR
ncbi:DUF2894 domain-containing protein [Cupriavidus sp. 2TAF22]|uniref:DUF2894 domain-containing protein n=1 Tax=unclassified Cupriavidus TaxID=2640874 RepID=UPI003F8E8CD2